LRNKEEPWGVLGCKEPNEDIMISAKRSVQQQPKMGAGHRLQVLTSQKQTARSTEKAKTGQGSTVSQSQGQTVRSFNLLLR
jgi:hypothetical protein